MLRRASVTLACVVAALAGSTAVASAADLNASPSNFASVFKSAGGGDVIHLASGSYGSFAGGTKTSFVTIQADSGVSASMSVDLTGSKYLRFKNLTLSKAYVSNSQYVEFVGNKFTGAVEVDTRDNTNTHILLDGNTHDNINVCGTCYEGRITVVGSDNSAPNGIVIRNSHLSGGDADGIQVTGNAYGTQIGPNNTFSNIVMVDQTHTDPIQLYHSRHTQIVGNFFYHDETGIMAADGADHEVIQDNVFENKNDGTQYPWAVLLGADNGSVVQHNTLVNSSCEWSMPCGTLRIWGGNQGVASRGTVVKDNILGSMTVEDGSTLASEDHNLIANDGAKNSTDIHGSPTYSGGSAPTAYSGFTLANGSLGKGSASDGTDRGIVGSAGSPPPAPAPPPPPPPSPTDHPAKAVWTAPTGATVGKPVTLDGTRSQGDAPLTCTWSFENQDGSTVWETATGCKITKTFQNVDTKYVRLTVKDNDGDTNSNRQSFAVTATPPAADQPAKAVWTAPTGATVGKPVTLDGTRSQGDAPLTCTWSFENQDGSTVWETATGCKITKTFQNVDTKYVRLTVKDNDGDTNSNRQSFAVGAAIAGLMASYGFNEPSAAVRDASGQGNDATAVHTTRVAGRHGEGLRFDARGSLVRTPNAPRLGAGRALTVEMWVRPTALGAAPRLLVGKANAYALYISGRTVRAAGYVRTRAHRSALASAAVHAGRWSFLALTFDGHRVRLYVNGALRSTHRVTGALAASRGAVRLGGGSASSAFRGVLDDVRIYDRALSARQIRAGMAVPA